MPLFSHSSDTAIGIDIGTTSIKAVVLQRVGKTQYKLANYAILESAGAMEHFNNAIQSSNLKPLESDLISYLRLAKQKLKLSSKTPVYATLPTFAAYTTLLDVPSSDKHRLNQALAEKASSYVPLPMSAVTLDWIVVGQSKAGQRVLLVSIPTEKIDSYNQIFTAAGLHLVGYEIETIAIARALTRGLDKPTLIIDIGGRSTSFAVGMAGRAMFSGQTDFSSGSLTQALATGLNISLGRADMLKRRTQIIGGAGEHELSTIMIPILDVIITEANRTKQGFEKAYGQPVAQALLTGSGANMPGFAAYLTEKISLPVQNAQVLKTLLYPPELEPVAGELGTTLTTAAGAALKGLS